jgi:hypothetical protein
MSVHLPQVSVFPASITIDREAATKALKGHVPRHFLGLLSIVRDYACGLLFTHQGHEPFTPPKAPWVVVIGDDLLTAEGPAGFHEESVRALLRDSYFVAIVATVAIPLPYDMASTCAARDRQNAVVIDTRPEQKDAWLAMVRDVQPDAAIHVSLPAEPGDGEA